VAIIVEFFVPSFGIIGAGGLGCIIASIVIVFRRSGTLAGSIYLGAAVVLVPVLMVLYFKFFPRSFVGRWLISQDRQDPGKGYATYSAEKYEDLLGKEGVSLTVLRPVGTARIDGRKFSVVTGGEFIEKDQPVKVIKVEGSRIVVRRGG
jgi:membrane-bound serine protease (ClpP class)